MTRKRGRGRPYQPLPKRSNRTYAIVILVIGLLLIVGVSILGTMR